MSGTPANTHSLQPYDYPILNEHGYHGDVIGPVVGFFGECSNHVTPSATSLLSELTKQRGDVSNRSHDTETAGVPRLSVAQSTLGTPVCQKQGEADPRSIT